PPTARRACSGGEGGASGSPPPWDPSGWVATGGRTATLVTTGAARKRRATARASWCCSRITWRAVAGTSTAGMTEPPDYVELHCPAGFSLLDGASAPEALLARAASLGMPALALTDHDDLGGAVRFAEAARELDVAGIIGAELSLLVEPPRVTGGQPPRSP